jgi:hypothetical protein
VIRFFSASTGKQIGEPERVDGGVAEVALSQNSPESLLAVIDKSRALHMIHVKSKDRMKFASVVDSVK